MKTFSLLLLLIFSFQAFSQSVNQPQEAGYWNAPSRNYIVKKAKRVTVQGLKKGTWIAGGYVSYGASTFTDEAKHIGLSAFGGYFIDNKLLIGFTGESGKEWINGAEGQINSFLLGPFLRYYVTNTRVAPFADVNYQLGHTNTITPYVTGKSSSRQPTSSFAVTGGLGLRITTTLRAEIAYKYQTDRLQSRALFKKNWVGYPQAGISAFF